MPTLTIPLKQREKVKGAIQAVDVMGIDSLLYP